MAEMRRIFLSMLSVAGFAGPFEEGMKSLKNGDFAEAYCLWRPLAMRGNADAAYHLGWLYANGNGLRVDGRKAVYWWTQAAQRGHTDAQFALGMAYTNGDGIKEDKSKAAEWFMRAAEAGNADARELIREMVRVGAEEIRPWLAKLVQQPWLGQRVRVKVEGANLRAGPGRDKPLLGRVKKGARLIVLDRHGRWCQVIEPAGLKVSWIAGWLTEAVGD